MTSIIEQIYCAEYPNLHNIEEYPEYGELIKKSYALQQKLSENFTDEQKNTLNEILNLEAAMEAEVAQNRYITGFKLGFRIAVEGLGK